MPGSRWTNKEVFCLINMVRAKDSIKDMAKELGKSTRGVQLKMLRLRITTGNVGCPLDIVRASVILDYILVGRSIVQIAKLMKRSYNSIRYTVHRLVRRGLVEKVDRRYKVTTKWSDRRYKD